MDAVANVESTQREPSLDTTVADTDVDDTTEEDEEDVGANTELRVDPAAVARIEQEMLGVASDTDIQTVARLELMESACGRVHAKYIAALAEARRLAAQGTRRVAGEARIHVFQRMRPREERMMPPREETQIHQYDDDEMGAQRLLRQQFGSVAPVNNAQRTVAFAYTEPSQQQQTQEEAPRGRRLQEGQQDF